MRRLPSLLFAALVLAMPTTAQGGEGPLPGQNPSPQALLRIALEPPASAQGEVPDRFLVSVQGQAGARGLRLKIATGELPILALRLLSLPSGQMLILAVDSQFVVSENGKKLAHAQGTASPLAILATSLRRAEFTVQIPPRPQGDDRLQLWLATVGPEGGEEERLIADAKVDSGEFSLSLWLMASGKMRSCCQGSFGHEMCIACPGAAFTCSLEPC